jgi:glycosyltransferase involved in cell wall biosynthesis
MDILYVSRLCSETRLAELLRDLPVKPAQQEQKFHGLLARGLAAFAQGLTALSLLPHNPGTDGFPALEVETERAVTYRYLTLRMVPGLSHLYVFAWSFFASLRWSQARRGRPRFMLGDVLDLSISAGALLASKVSGTPAIAIVTDVPDFLHDYIGGAASPLGRLAIRAYRALSTFCMERYDGYIVLTEAMNPVVNPKGKPHLVMEGMVDPGMGDVSNTLEAKLPEAVVIYAGALYAKYGVQTLLEAFLRVPHPQARLWLYGAGELEAMIQEQAIRDPRIKYFGVRPNPEVVAVEVRATLLVNPRPSTEAFTAYSFPSKNMEYMASGTPVLTTPLPGMPEEYFEHVYLFSDESVEGMAATLKQLLELPREELHRRGEGAKRFVLSHKTNGMQAYRVGAFLQSLGRN